MLFGVFFCPHVGVVYALFFFKQKTAYEMRISDWSSDVCSSDLVTVRTTYLGAHAIPPEFDRRPEEYIDTVVADLPKVAASGLADAVDGFCERIAFYPEQKIGRAHV